MDQTGKTTLVRAAADRLNAEVVHRGPPKDHPLVEYAKPLDGYRPGSGRSIVCDRWHWGERVWPTIYERSTEYTDKMHAQVEDFLAKRGAVVVHATSSPAAIIERLDGSPYPPADRVQEALTLFEGVCLESRLPTFHYDFKQVPLADSLDALIELAERVDRYAAEEMKP